jgi:hypothetical protein
MQRKSFNIPTETFLNIIDENTVKQYCFSVLMYKTFKISVLYQSQIEKTMCLRKASVSFFMYVYVSQTVLSSVCPHGITRLPLEGFS